MGTRIIWSIASIGVLVIALQTQLGYDPENQMLRFEDTQEPGYASALELLTKTQAWFSNQEYDKITDALTDRYVQENQEGFCDLNAYLSMAYFKLAYAPSPRRSENRLTGVGQVYEHQNECAPYVLEDFLKELGDAEYIESPFNQFTTTLGTGIVKKNIDNQRVKIVVRDQSDTHLGLWVRKEENGRFRTLCEHLKVNPGHCLVKKGAYQNIPETGLKIRYAESKERMAKIELKFDADESKGFCKDFANPEGKMHVAVASHGYEGDANGFLTDLENNAFLLENALKTKYPEIKISYFEKEVPCTEIERDGRKMLRCEIDLVQVACNTNPVYVLIRSPPDPKKPEPFGSSLGFEANSLGSQPAAMRHEIAHLLFELPDRYPVYQRGTTIYDTQEQCLEFIKQIDGSDSNYEKYVQRFLTPGQNQIIPMDSVIRPRHTDFIQTRKWLTQFGSLTEEQKSKLVGPLRCRRYLPGTTDERHILDQESIMTHYEEAAYSLDEFLVIQNRVNRVQATT